MKRKLERPLLPLAKKTKNFVYPEVGTVRSLAVFSVIKVADESHRDKSIS